MKENHHTNDYQCIIVGGGIVGAGIFRDLALNGVKTLLVDAHDFSSQTSQSSSKMLHGGIRYLENLDFKLVFEALHEKNLWLKIAPHATKEMPFYLPVYKDAKRPLWMIRAGLFLYDALSTFKNSPFKMKSVKESLHDLPGLKKSGLTGAGFYFDGIMDDAKLTLEVIYDGLLENNSKALTHTEVIDIKKEKETSHLTLRDNLTGKVSTTTADYIIYALGPFTDQFLKRFPIYHWKDVLLPSKGSHIWISKDVLPLEHAMVMTPQDEYGDRVIFIIPHDDRILIGTTEVPATGSFFDLTPDQSEIDYLLKNLNLYFPDKHFTQKDILSSYAGIRPLVKEDVNQTDRSKTSREHKIYRPLKDTFVIAGGKYTTFRVMGQEITKHITNHFQKGFNPDKTLSPLRQVSVISSFKWHMPSDEELKTIIEKEIPRTFDDLVKRRLSIPSKKTWDQKCEITFDEYFYSKTSLLAKYLATNEDEIKKSIQHF